MTERSDLLLFERMCENDCAVISLLFCTCTPELPLWRLELQIFWRFAYFKVMKIIQGSHVIILYHFCSLYLAVYFYIDSTYESPWTMRYWSSNNNHINDFGPYTRSCVPNTGILGISELRKGLELSVLNYSEYKMNNFVRKTTAELTCAEIEDIWNSVVEMYFWRRSVSICYAFNSNFQIFKSL